MSITVIHNAERIGLQGNGSFRYGKVAFVHNDKIKMRDVLSVLVRDGAAEIILRISDICDCTVKRDVQRIGRRKRTVGHRIFMIGKSRTVVNL